MPLSQEENLFRQKRSTDAKLDKTWIYPLSEDSSYKKNYSSKIFSPKKKVTKRTLFSSDAFENKGPFCILTNFIWSLLKFEDKIRSTPLNAFGFNKA